MTMTRLTNCPVCGAENEVTRATPKMIAAAWRAFRKDRLGPLLGPGPAFVEAINAALNAQPAKDDAP